ncbi:MAG TPA: hypothetical protein VFI41_09820, partial [Gemmatimonadales bacterium]|nr:hypothetical protein [Gemmatimonadales bacterium]
MRRPLSLLAALACTATFLQGCDSSERNLAGDWDVYIALSAQPKFGFEGWRRMAYAHFAGRDSGN